MSAVLESPFLADSAPLAILTRDLKSAATTLTPDEARYLVDNYYAMQKFRIRCGNQVSALGKADEPHATVSFFGDQFELLEDQIRSALDKYSNAQAVGRWARAQKGIGPVIAAGLLAHIDIEKAPTAGHIWAFAGLDPSKKWDKGQKRPWNASLKRLCWIMGESFVKVSGYDDAYYGKLYATRKVYETTKNENGDYADQALESLRSKRFGDDTQAKKHYEAGRLPPARIHLRAKRYATKLFLAHFHHVAYVEHFGAEPPLPYPIAHLGHAHFIAPPLA
jgi:hypothetical protein